MLSHMGHKPRTPAFQILNKIHYTKSVFFYERANCIFSASNGAALPTAVEPWKLKKQNWNKEKKAAAQRIATPRTTSEKNEQKA